jgi:hypothetical protein
MSKVESTSESLPFRIPGCDSDESANLNESECDSLASLLALFQSVAPMIRYMLKRVPIGEEIEALVHTSCLDHETTSGMVAELFKLGYSENLHADANHFIPLLIRGATKRISSKILPEPGHWGSCLKPFSVFHVVNSLTIGVGHWFGAKIIESRRCRRC